MNLSLNAQIEIRVAGHCWIFWRALFVARCAVVLLKHTTLCFMMMMMMNDDE
jgi:hypothetical protein